MESNHLPKRYEHPALTDELRPRTFVHFIIDNRLAKDNDTQARA